MLLARVRSDSAVLSFSEIVDAQRRPGEKPLFVGVAQEIHVHVEHIHRPHVAQAIYYPGKLVPHIRRWGPKAS